MKKSINIVLAISVIGLLLSFNNFSYKMGGEPWTKEQLLQPADLAATLKNTKIKQPVVINIGPAGNIKNSVLFGSTQEKENLDALKNFLNKLPKNTDIVLYCGCCPFEHCPNIRPAFELLNQMNFTNHKLLNLSHNLKTDWIDKGYPMN